MCSLHSLTKESFSDKIKDACIHNMEDRPNREKKVRFSLMETSIRSGKKHSAGKIIFWLFGPVLLVLILALLLFGALSLFGFSYDDQTALLAQAPMSADQRYTFHAQERTVDTAVNTSDILFILSQEGEITPAALQSQLKAYGVDLSAYGLSLAKYGVRFDDGVSVTLLFKWLGFVPIPLQLDVDTSLANGELNLQVSRIHITKLAAVSLKTLEDKFGLDTERLSFQISLEDLNTWLSDVRSVSFSSGNMVLTYGIGEELFSEVRTDAYFAQHATYYIDGISELTIFLNAFSEKEGTLKLGDDFTALLGALEADPGMIEDVRINCLSLAYPYHANKAFAGEKGLYLTRFLPNVTQEAVTARHDQYYSLYEERVMLMGQLIQEQNKLYQNEKISYSDANLLNAETGDKLVLSQIVEDFTPYDKFLSETDSRFMLCSGDIQAIAFGFETPLKHLPHDKDVTYPGLDKDEVYMILLLTRMKNGEPAFVYLAVTLTAVMIDPISEEEYNSYMQSEYVPTIAFGS